jgi:hypothetical protein
MFLPGLIVPGWNQDLNTPIRLGSPYYLAMSIALTGTVNENITGQTPQNYNEDLLVRAGTTDLESSQVQFQLPGTLAQLWSQAAVSVRSMFGQTGSARPYFRYPYPLPLPVSRFISASVLNVNGEDAGTFVFQCQQGRITTNGFVPSSIQSQAYNSGRIKGLSQAKDGGWMMDPKRLGPMQIIPVDSQFTGTASEQTSSDGVLNPVDYDFLLLGLTSDLALAKIQIIDVERRQWMSYLTVGGNNLCPVWAVAGTPNAQNWIQYLPLPYLIPAQRMPTFNFQNDATAPEASGQVYMVGQQLLD